MNDYYLFDIEFPSLDLNNYYIKSEDANTVHQARLYLFQNEIEVRIYYNPKTYFGEKLGMWSSKINWLVFGSYIKTSKENQNYRLQKIDLNNAKLTGLSNSTNYIENHLKYIKIKIDQVKFYWVPAKEEVNTAEFYLNESGFDVVKHFYSIMFGLDGEFNFQRMKGQDTFYKIGKSRFRPEFNFNYSDDKDKNEVTIIKEPKLQFEFTENISEKDACQYAEVVRLVLSFYCHSNIDFIYSRINLTKYKITIHKTEGKSLKVTRGGLWAFKNHMNIHRFLLANWQSKTVKNFQKISKAIELFNQSLLVDSNSQFLIRYNIIEICNNEKQSGTKFKKVLDSKACQKKYNNALKLLLDTISEDEHAEFTNKWKFVSSKLSTKPMKSPLLSFFENQNLNPIDFPVSLNEIKKLRDNIVHGSIKKVSSEKLRKANILLYRITGILILNLMGISEWEFNSDIN